MACFALVMCFSCLTFTNHLTMIHVRVILNVYRMDDPVACGHGRVVFCAHVEGGGC